MQSSMLETPHDLLVVHKFEPVEYRCPQCNCNGGKPHLYSQQKYKIYKEALSWAMKAAWTGTADGVNEFWIKLDFRCGSDGRKRARDYDNLAKTVGDAGNGIVWKDDSQITQCRGVEVVRGSMEPRTIIQAGLR